MFTISIVGRANVGKSTLFNKLAGQKLAIVYDQPGTTRDYKETKTTFGELDITLVDTGGYTYSRKKQFLESEINHSTEAAIRKSDLIYFVVDRKAGLLDEDKLFAKQILKLKLPIILVINKCDNSINSNELSEFYKIPVKDICGVSAEHSVGFNHLYDLTHKYYQVPQEKSEKDRPIKITFIGKPNVGKSTFINALLKEERVVVSPKAGTTRDSINIDFEYKNRKLQIIDTAGLRKKNKVQESLERLSTAQTFSSVRQSDIAVLLIDINSPLEVQDLKISSVIVEGELKPLIIVLNKIDTKTEQEVLHIKQEVEHKITKKIPLIKDIPIILTSALNKKNIEKVLVKCIEISQASEIQIPSSRLNLWLQDIVTSHSPPLSASKTELRLKFIKQISNKPLMFKLFMNKPKELPSHYIRYLTKSLQNDFKISSIPIKIHPTSTKNPYIQE